MVVSFMWQGFGVLFGVGWCLVWVGVFWVLLSVRFCRFCFLCCVFCCFGLLGCCGFWGFVKVVFCVVGCLGFGGFFFLVCGFFGDVFGCSFG